MITKFKLFENFDDDWNDGIINMPIRNLNDALTQRFLIWSDIEGSRKRRMFNDPNYLNKLYSNNLILIEKYIKETPLSEIDKEPNKDGYSPLIFAIKKCFIQDMDKVIKLLIDKGADINQHESSFGYTPLMCAADQENIEIVKYLIEKNVDINGLSNYNRTALHEAVDTTKPEKAIEVVKTLVENGINLDVQENYYKGYTALIKSVKGKNFCSDLSPYDKITNYLIKSGANINIQNDYGETALIKAAKEKNYKLIASLIKAGANWRLYDKHNKCFYDYMKTKNMNKLANDFPEIFNEYIIHRDSKKYNL